jgi:RNA polymerase sigma factor (TIGR02999 family)
LETTLSQLFEAAGQGNSKASKDLFAVLYEELHRLAKCQLAREAGPLSLGATTLLHEAYLDMAGREGPAFPDQSRFMGYAARVMRSLIIDYVRERRAQKRGGLFEITSLETSSIDAAVDHKGVAQIGEALDELAKAEPSLAEIVDLRFFCGFSFAEIAAMRNVSERTVQRSWERARIYLYRSIRADLSI